MKELIQRLFWRSSFESTVHWENNIELNIHVDSPVIFKVLLIFMTLNLEKAMKAIALGWTLRISLLCGNLTEFRASNRSIWVFHADPLWAWNYWEKLYQASLKYTRLPTIGDKGKNNAKRRCCFDWKIEPERDPWRESIECMKQRATSYRKVHLSALILCLSTCMCNAACSFTGALTRLLDRFHVSMLRKLGSLNHIVITSHAILLMILNNKLYHDQLVLGNPSLTLEL